MFTQAIVRTPSQSMVEGITTAGLGSPNYTVALQQHTQYIAALENCGLEVTVLPATEEFPDACFVEDVALLTTDCGIITRPGAFSRRGETNNIRATVESFYDELEEITSPGSLDAGDIMMVDDHFFIGLSQRTNQFGANQLKVILEKYGMTSSFIRLNKVLHLKTGIAYLENNNLLASGEFLTHPDLQKFNILEVSEDEAYAANSVWVNDQVLTPAGFPKTTALLVAAGYEIIEIDASEFQKLDGGLSCLSLRF